MSCRSASLLNYLKFHNARNGKKQPRGTSELPRFRYCFYLDFLASSLDSNTQNALAHLREQADFVRVLGSYPQKSRLVGPVKDVVDRIRHLPAPPLAKLPPTQAADALTIGIIGIDDQHQIGQSMAKLLIDKKQKVVCTDMKADRVRRNAFGWNAFLLYTDSSCYCSRKEPRN